VAFALAAAATAGAGAGAGDSAPPSAPPLRLGPSAVVGHAAASAAAASAEGVRVAFLLPVGEWKSGGRGGGEGGNRQSSMPRLRIARDTCV